MLYPIGIQNFEKIIKGGFVYVDKTDLVYNLIHRGQYYFLSRPRRFGKSLLVSTIESYFKGDKDLFQDLKIFTLEKEWIQYPTLHLDFSGRSYLSPQDLYHALDSHLSQWEGTYCIGHIGKDLSSRFINVIDTAFKQTGKQVVILVDEYDKPIIDNISNIALMEEFRSILQGLYSVIKVKDPQIRFAFFTGVTKLGKLSVFSGLNNLQDISLDSEYNAICGITHTELQMYFKEDTTILADTNKLSIAACLAKLEKMYDGYRFHPSAEGIYNPFSLFNALSKKAFGEYWFETGTPSSLVKYLKSNNYILDDITKNDVPQNLLTGSNYENPLPITLMFQTGYLTIKGYNPRFNTYRLDYPNEEVKSGFWAQKTSSVKGQKEVLTGHPQRVDSVMSYLINCAGRGTSANKGKY